MSVEKLDIKHVRQAQKSFTTHLTQVLQNIPDAFVLGIYCYLSSLPHDWVVNRNHLMKHFSVGRDRIKSAMAWLHVHHLIEYEQERNSDNTFGKSLIIVKDGNEFVEYIFNERLCEANKHALDAGGLKISHAEAGGLKTRRTEKPLDGKTAPTYINIKDTKEIKETKSNIVVLPGWLNTEAWEEFKQHRKDLKKPMTPLAERKAINLLARLKLKGQDVYSIINTSIINGWSGLFEPKGIPLAQNRNESKSTVKFFEPGNPDYDRIHGRH